MGTSGERVEYGLKAEALGPAKTSGEAKVDPDPRKPVERKAEKLTVTAVKQLSGTCR